MVWLPAGQRRTAVSGRHRKMDSLAEESVRSAQRGLLVLFGSALVWIAIIWAGYRYFS